VWGRVELHRLRQPADLVDARADPPLDQVTRYSGGTASVNHTPFALR
jgi:hypothetical protein